MKTIIILLAVFFLTAQPQAQVTQQWVRGYNGFLNWSDVAQHITTDGSGNVYVTGYSSGSWNTHSVIITIKYNTSGTQQWLAQYGNYAIDYNAGAGIAVDNSGNVYVLSNDLRLIKYNSSGVQQWVAQTSYEGASYGIALDNAGNIFITGSAIIITEDCITIKYNPNGVQQWMRLYNYGNAFAITVDGPGNVYVTGIYPVNGGNDYLTLKYSNSGTLQWASQYHGPVTGYDAPNSIAVDGSGNSYVTGRSFGTDGYFHCATVKYNSSGAQQWVKNFNGGGIGDDWGEKVIFKNGYIYVAGSTQEVGTNRDFLILKYSPSGNETWQQYYNGPVNGRDEAKSIVVDDFNDVYVTGASKGTDGITHMTTVRYNENGSQQWVQRYNSGQCSGFVDEQANDIALGPSGGVYITGYVTHIDANCSYQDYCTIKYTQTGLGITPLSGNLPEEYSLEQNYPNPFNPSTDIKFSIPKSGNVKLAVYDLLGNEISILANEHLSAGIYKAEFDGTNLASGIYLCRLEAEGFTDVKKMSLVK